MRIITELSDYEKLAQRTAGTNDDVNMDTIIERIADVPANREGGYNGLLSVLISLLKFSRVGDDATRLKSQLFYGKLKPLGFDTDIKINNAVYGVNYSEMKERLLSLNPKILHAILGLVSEAGEFTAHVLDHIATGATLDPEHLIKELGDSSWFVVEGAVGVGTTLQNVAETNIDKLLKRFPGKFTPEDAVARKDEA